MEEAVLENASLAFESAIPAKRYKEEIKEKDKKIEELYKALGRAQIERDWVLKKLAGFPQKCIFVGLETVWTQRLEKAWWGSSSKNYLSPGNANSLI